MQIISTLSNIKNKKRSFLQLLFLFFISTQLHAFVDFKVVLSNSLSSNHYNDPTWLRLLHLHKDVPDIKDPAFYINGKFIDAKDEFISTYNSFFIQVDQKVKCRFPARFLWMREKFNFQELTLGDCPDFKEFLNNAPVDKVSVVFASENLTVPTSMMGHIFLKISGEDQKKQAIDHSISFFTNVEHASFPELAFKSLVTGMKGYYSLSPYQSQKNAYLYNEQRNIWEYEIKLSDKQRELVQYHLYELKNITFTYLFHGFNCATLINNILNVSHPKLDEDRTLWVTPLDVIRSIDKHELIKQTYMIPSSEWKIKSLLESVNIDSQNLKKIKLRNYSNLELDQYTKNQKYLIWEVSRAFNNYMFEEEKISRNEWTKDNEFLVQKREEIYQNAQLDSSDYKKPSRTIQDSQYFLEYVRRDNSSLMRMGFMPASHKLQDDTSNYSNESELKLGEVILSYESRSKKLRVDEVTVYAATMLKPSDTLISGWSGNFHINYGPLIGPSFTFEHYYYADVGFGKTYRIYRDVDLYGLLNSSFITNHYTSLQAFPEIGMIIREVGNMKTLFSYKKQFSSKKSLSNIDEINVTQALNLKGFSFDLNYQYFFKESQSIKNYSLGIKRFF